MRRFRKQKNATSHRNIGLLKTAIKEELNKISAEIILQGIQIVSNVRWYNNWKKNCRHIE